MANCDPIYGIPKNCSDGNIGTLVGIWLLPLEDVTYTAVTGTVSSYGVLTGFTASSTPVEIKVNKNSANYTETSEANIQTDGRLWTQTINITLPYRETAKRNSIASYAQGNRDLILFGKDGNGIIWTFGYEAGVNLQSTGGGSGEAREAGSSYTLTFVGMERYQAIEIDETLFESLI